MSAPERVWVFGELEGWHNTGHGRARDFNRYPLDDRERATGAEYVRADIVQELVDALGLIYSSVYNDNGDVTYDASAMFKASRIARAALAKLKEAGS